MNRIREVLDAQRRTNKWLSEQLNVDRATIANWCNNKTQPTIIQAAEIARILGVTVNDLLEDEKQ